MLQGELGANYTSTLGVLVIRNWLFILLLVTSMGTTLSSSVAHKLCTTRISLCRVEVDHREAPKGTREALTFTPLVRTEYYVCLSLRELAAGDALILGLCVPYMHTV